MYSLYYIIAFPEDLFRYASKGVRSYAMSSKQSAYFSIDGGNTMLAQFNNVNNGGDAGDWSTNSPNQAQNAYGSMGTYADLNVEKVILDVLGYSLIDIPDLSKTPTKSPSKVPTKNPNTPPPPFKITATYSAALLAHLQTTQIQAAITAAIEAYQNIILSTGTASIAFDLSSSVGNKFL